MEERNQGGIDWYVRDLMVYMFGVPPEDLDGLVEQYASSGGTPDPAGLFKFLSVNGRKYRVLWAAFPVGDLISILSPRCSARTGR